MSPSEPGSRSTKRVLLQSADAGTPAFEALRELAAHKLPHVESLIERAQAMRAWLLPGTDCSCTSLDVCALFDGEEECASGSDGAERFDVTHVGGVAA